MKKFFLIIIILSAIFLAFAYIYVPATITISETKEIEASKEGLKRKLGDKNQWKAWWPGEKQGEENPEYYYLSGYTYTVQPQKFLSIPFNINDKRLNAEAELTFISNSIGWTTLNITTKINSTNNPFNRVLAFIKSRSIKKNFVEILNAIKDYYSKAENVYGFNIQSKSVVDSTLLFTSAEINGKPDVTRIYAMIDELKNYIKKFDAKETGLPMLNIYTEDSITYRVKVAIPVNKKLPDSDNISYKWMLGGGNILITEVKGGQPVINKAYEQIRNFIADYHRVAPAIPFESLVTNRKEEKDSSKWITRIYYPVM